MSDFTSRAIAYYRQHGCPDEPSIVCDQCKKSFEAGRNGKRIIARFCSDTCRNRFHYEKRNVQFIPGIPEQFRRKEPSPLTSEDWELGKKFAVIKPDGHPAD